MDSVDITIVRLRGWLRERRVRAGLSQYDLAEASGVCQTTLSRIERGERKLTVEALLRIAAALDVDALEALSAATRSEIAPASCSAA